MTAIYLAARYGRRVELCTYRADLLGLGHTVTGRWLDGHHQVSDDGLSAQGTEAERERFAQEDWLDLRAAAVCISFTEPPRSAFSRGGRHVEHGAALAWGLRTIVVGPRENVFHCLPQVVRFETWLDLLYVVEILGRPGAEAAAASYVSEVTDGGAHGPGQ